MLVKFDSDVGSITMFGDIAVTLLKFMGHSGTVPSAILADDIPGALKRLESALAGAPAPSAGHSKHNSQDQDEEREPPVSLRQRAHPLMELLTRAAERGCDVTWK